MVELLCLSFCCGIFVGIGFSYFILFLTSEILAKAERSGIPTKYTS